MTDLTLVCPDCGGLIEHSCTSQSGAIGVANVAQSGVANRRKSASQAQIAHGSKSLDLDPSPNGARAYNQGYDQDFLAFYKLYPLKRDKRKAQSAWRKAVARLGANLGRGSAQSRGANLVEAMAQINAAAIAYRDDPNRADEFTKYPATWLNADSYLDGPLPPRGQAKLGWLDETYRRATHGGP